MLFKYLFLIFSIFILANTFLSTKANELALGKKAKTKEITISIQKPTELNYKSIEEIFRSRISALNRYPLLLADKYEPCPEIFGLLESEKPWWGLYGMHVYRRGQRSIEGPAKESIYLLNPYMLVCAEPIAAGIWDKNRISTKELCQENFPFFWKAQNFKYFPNRSCAELDYNVSNYWQRLRQWSNYSTYHDLVKGFSLIAYNARDFGYNFMYCSAKKSINISNSWQGNHPFQIQQMLHCGGSCGYPGGCNNMSPFMPELDNMSITALPARIHILLWKEEPTSSETPADFVYIINFI